MTASLWSLNSVVAAEVTTADFTPRHWIFFTKLSAKSSWASIAGIKEPLEIGVLGPTTTAGLLDKCQFVERRSQQLTEVIGHVRDSTCEVSLCASLFPPAT